MTGRHFRTLAYTKSPKLSKRTNFQDELEAAVSARAKKALADQRSLSDDFSEEENDFLKELLKSRKKRTDTFKSLGSKARNNDFQLSDDEGENVRPKRVSFLKTQRISSLSLDKTASNSYENGPPSTSLESSHNQSDSFPSQHSSNLSEEQTKFQVSETRNVDPTRKSPSDSLSNRTLEDSQPGTPCPSTPGNGMMEALGPLSSEMSEESHHSVHGEEQKSHTPQPLGSGLSHMSSTDSVIEREPPRPKPRKRTLGLNFHTMEEWAEDADSPMTRAPTSSVSIPLSTDTASNITTISSPDRISARDYNSHGLEGDDKLPCNLSKSSSFATSEQSHLLNKSTVGSGTRDTDNLTSDDTKDYDGKYSSSFEEHHESEDHSDHSISRIAHSHEKSVDTRPSSSIGKSSQTSQNVCFSRVQSKYMGTLKVLDRKVPIEEFQPETADSLRAAVYQEWLKKKKEKLRENIRLKREEGNLKDEKRKKDEQAKKEEAVAAFRAWKEKKGETLRIKAKEKQDNVRNEQIAIEEKEEKMQAAAKVFEKWKQEHDDLLKKKYRKKRESENKFEQKKQEKEEDRMQDSKSAFSNWNETKKNLLNEKVKIERKKHQKEAAEEQNKKEERDKMALEMYENWLARKERERIRQREERRIQAILEDSPPPPWSPPNKTIPFRK
ncbi:microtubule-associated protein 9 [Lampris incognitus]|uniref:microtubule-associated protein 9 n=1 Tax=Lampris incognitus TaxID=2546036 RepID=UPI0024B4F97B|nr:microtubule-associated protein 9 [Lampris incognitus]